MDIQTCRKYLDFVSIESIRHLKDREITDDELISLIIELQRFQEKCLNSNLPEELKLKISEIKLNYSIKGVERGGWFLVAAFVTFGTWALIIYYRQQSKRKETLQGIQFDTSRLASFIRMNYSL